MNASADKSPVRSRVLLSLLHQSASSVTALASDLGTPRPSASRVVKALLVEGLVSRQGRTLELTDPGVVEARRIRDSLPKKAAKDRITVQRLMARQAEYAFYDNTPIVEAARKIGNLNSALITNMTLPVGLLPQVPIEVFTQDIAKTVMSVSMPVNAWQSSVGVLAQRLSETMGGISYSPLELSVATSDVVRSALNSAARTQHFNVELLEQVGMQSSIAPRFNDLFADNSAAISQMMADLGAIVSIQYSGRLSDLIRSIGETVRSYDSYYQSAINELVDFNTNAVIPFDRFSTDLYLPTLTTARLVESTRTFVEGYDATSLKQVPHDDQPKRWEQEAALLDPYLAYLPPRFGKMWRGAWSSLYSDNPDRIRHATSSGREFISQILHHYAPDSCFTSEEIERDGYSEGGGAKRPTRRMRVKRALGDRNDSGVDFVNNIAKSLDASYNFLNGEVHSHFDEERYSTDTIKGLFISLVGWLGIFICMREKEQNGTDLP